MVDHCVTFGGVTLEHPLMNAAGTCKLLPQVEALARSSVSAIVVGSITIDERSGNPGNTYFPHRYWSLNSLGLPNPGAKYYEQHLPAMVSTAHNADKPLIVSVAGFTLGEYVDLAKLCFNAGVDLVELNFGCPNVWGSSEQKPILSFNPEGIAVVLDKLERQAPRDCKFGVKLSPYSDPGMLGRVAKVLAAVPLSYVATSNTFPNATFTNEAGRPVIDVGLAGLSGHAMLPIGLGQVHQFRSLLPPGIPLVGVGGISAGADLLDYLRQGAVAVQLATAFWNSRENPDVFTRILTQYIDQFLEEG